MFNFLQEVHPLQPVRRPLPLPLSVRLLPSLISLSLSRLLPVLPELQEVMDKEWEE